MDELDIENLFKTLKHDAVLTAMMLVSIEVAGGEPVEIPENSTWCHHINHYRHELRRALRMVQQEEVTHL
jgi:hypothetical protein